MTLDIPQFIANSIRTQSKIHHLDINVKTTTKDDIPSSVTSIIEKDYGKKYLDDANYVAFFWGGIGKEQIEKLFNVVDKALGKSANKLTDKDFKKLSLKSANDNTSSDDQDEDIEVDDDSISDVEDDEEDIEDTEEDVEEDVELDEDDEDVDIDDEVEVDDDDDDEQEEVEVDIKEDKPIPTAYFFLKITIK